ncbi:hypothetical protein LL912_04265 [Niabella sp. CC-SYL272]|uniref:hypothetical protein n=1 Tax=Niabella agricola TaxID=2891571 RepID=UPI001F402955|nr:hypothetical protein [Niabella agricola]MCF3107986.1 hypothetical protein [Niabella agricola]
MLKRIMALFFLMAFAMQTFSKTIMMIDYRVNQQAYAKNCVNKFRPKMHCNGHCQLMKKIEEDEKKSQQNPERKLEFKNEITLSSKSFFPELTFIAIQQAAVYYNPTMGTEVKRPRSVFHPPAAAFTA